MKAYLVLLIVVAASAAVLQQRKISALRREVGKTSPVLAEVPAASNNSPAQLTPEKIAQMRADRLELMRLRASIPDLRSSARTPDNIEAEIQKLEQETEAEETKARLFKVTQEAEQKSYVMRGTLTSVSHLLQAAAAANGGQIVRSVQELERAAKNSNDLQNFPQIWEGLTKGYEPYHITLNHFEFIPEAATRDGILILRERQPRQLPDGRWARTYLTTDFQVNEQRLPTPDFATWEAETF